MPHCGQDNKKYTPNYFNRWIFATCAAVLQSLNLNAYLQLTAIKVPEINRSIFCRVLQYKADSKEGLEDLKQKR